MIESKDMRIHKLEEACKEFSAVLSEIDYYLGEPNEMRVSEFDLHCDPWAVAKAVKEKIEGLQNMVWMGTPANE